MKTNTLLNENSPDRNRIRIKGENEILKRKSLKDKIRKSRKICLLYTSPSPRDGLLSRMPSSA